MPTRHPFARCSVLALVAPLLGPVCAQEAKALLHAPLVVLPVDSAPFQRLADVDGDGDLDAIGTRIHENRSNTQIVIWRNDQGVFTVAWQGAYTLGGIQSPAPRSFAVATADWNGDGRTDFVVAGGNGAELFWSSPGFTFARAPYPLPQFTDANCHAVATGDFDGDARPDLALAFMRNGTLGGELHVLLAAGATITTTFSATHTAPLRVHALELDGVPGQEILVSDRNSPTARVYALAGRSLQLQQTLTTAVASNYPTPWKWMGGDLDGDADVDVIVFRPPLGTNNPANYQLFRRTGPTTLVAEPVAAGGPAEYLADIDGDGDLDGICCGGGGPSYQWPVLDFPSNFQITPNLGGGLFPLAWTFPGAGSESMAGAGDVDGDGDVDFVAGRCVFHGAGPWLEHPLPVATGPNTTGLLRPSQLHDVDRDGDPDYGPYLRNTGNGTPVQVMTEPAPPNGHVFGGGIEVDVDGDGANDRVVRLIAVQPPQPAQFVAMAWLQNIGGGHLRYAGTCAPAGVMIGSQYAYGIDDYVGADLDGDGDGDLIANADGVASQVFWNVQGTFTPGPVFDVLTGGRVERVADFDGDGLPDLLMTGNMAGMHVRRGTGVAAQPFQTTWSAPALPFEPAAIATGDVDGDGKLDFARPNALGEVVLFVNTSPPGGGPTFAATTLVGPRLVVAGSSPPLARSTLAIADFDGDGRADLALGRVVDEPNVGIVLRGLAWSNPPSIADYEVLRQTFVDGHAADVDLDGDPDLVAGRVARSRRFEGVAAGRRTQHHAGVAGEAGAVPVLGATGPFRSGFVEQLRLTGVPGPTLAILGLSLGEVELPGVPLPGLTLRLDPSTLLVAGWAITQDGDGRAAAMTTMPILLIPGQLGFVYYLQAFVLDAAAPQGFSQSNLMIKQVGA